MVPFCNQVQSFGTVRTIYPTLAHLLLPLLFLQVLLLVVIILEVEVEIEGFSNWDTQNSDAGGVICYYCHELGNTTRTCWHLQNRTQYSSSTHVATTPNLSSEQTFRFIAPLVP